MTANTLYYGDNLDILPRYIKDESIDLIYLDPPFKSDQDYNILFAEKNGTQSKAQIKAFEDTWRWDQGAAEAYQEIVEHGPQKASQVMQAFRTFLGENDMLAYLSMMAPRLVEMRRVLKVTGSIFLHCDPTASHYLKILMDAVFSPTNFRNEVVWKRTPFAGSSKARAKQFPKNHDIIIWFSASKLCHYQPCLLPYEEKYYKRFRNPDNDPRGPYQSVLLKTYSTKTFSRLKAENRLISPQRPGAGWRYKQFLSDLKGRQAEDIWTDINAINPVAKERLGYPTQKPEALLERIIKASTKEGDLIMDPFCGCGTAICVAQRLNRNWIGIDITHLAITLIKHRLQDAFGNNVKYEVIGEPVSLPDAETLAKSDPYQFQWWALGLVGARPTEQKKGADKGIDGRIYFHDEAKGGKTKQIVLQVKGGHVTASQIRDLRGVAEREKAEIGVFITLQTPTRAMRKEVASAGFYDSTWGTRHPKLQILTIEELLDGKQIDYPAPGSTSRTFKKAPKAKEMEEKQQDLF